MTETSPRSGRRRADLAALAAGILLGLFTAAGVLAANAGGERVVTCSIPGTGLVGQGAVCESGGATTQAVAR
jgi:hypothetical protein